MTLWDVAAQRIVEITGPDALAFTNLLTPRDLTECAVGQCKYVVITAPDGGILNDPLLLRLDEDRFWLSRADGDVLLWARGVAVNAPMDVEIGEPDVAPLQIKGPKSRRVMEGLFGDDVTELDYYECTRAELDDIPLVVSRTGWSAELGYEIYLRDGTPCGRAVGSHHDRRGALRHLAGRTDTRTAAIRPGEDHGDWPTTGNRD